MIFPCTRTRRDVLEAAGAPHEGGADARRADLPGKVSPGSRGPAAAARGDPISVNWRLRVPDAEELRFDDFRPVRSRSGR